MTVADLGEVVGFVCLLALSIGTLLRLLLLWWIIDTCFSAELTGRLLV